MWRPPGLKRATFGFASVLVSLVWAGEPPETSHLVAGWPQTRERIEELLSKATPAQVADFWRSALQPYGSRDASRPSPDVLREAASRVARTHASPETRCLSMVYAVLARGPDYEFLKERFSGDPDAVVKRAAIRLAGVLGAVEGNLDLSHLLLNLDDPELYEDVIQARTLWADTNRIEDVRGLEPWDGFACTLPYPLRYHTSRKLSEAEREHLRRTLETSAHPRIRDSASAALVVEYHYTGGSLTWRAPELKVHEWGVWIDREGFLGPSKELIDDLPDFVHRARITAAEYWSRRSYSPMRITKPVVFFYTPQPVSLLVRTYFFQGRPWTFYPEATDYAESIGTLGFPKTRGLKDLAKDGVAPAAQPGMAPDWIEPWREEKGPPPGFSPREVAKAAPVSGELRRRYRVAPWLIPNHPVYATFDVGGRRAIIGFGLEWRGLRLGYGPALEGKPARAPEDSWWSNLRAVPSSTVAVRGNVESFLFYDGAARVPSPIRVTWSDATRSGVLLGVRSFEEYPRPEEWLGMESKKTGKTKPIPAVFVLACSEASKARGRALTDLGSEAGPFAVPLEELDLHGEHLTSRFLGALKGQGLTDPEAASLVETWKSELFERPGVRVVTVLPQWMYDSIVPIEMYPEPGELARVGLVVKECRELEVGVAPLSLNSPATRWKPAPIAVQERAAVIVEYPISPEKPEPLSIGEDGELFGTRRGGYPAISGDGKKIAFLEEIGEHVFLCVADIENRTSRRITCLGKVDLTYKRHISISEDGSRIAFGKTHGKDYPDRWSFVCVADVKEAKLYMLHRTNRHCGFPTITPDGRTAAFAGWDTLNVIDIDARKEWVVDERCGGLTPISLSASGKELAIIAARDDIRDICVVDIEKKTMINLSQSRSLEDYPSISADGRAVAFQTEVDRDEEIYLADVAAKTLRNVTDRAGSDTKPLMTPDGKRLLFHGDFDRLQLLDLDAGVVRSVPGFVTSWARGASISSHGSRIVFRREIRRRDAGPGEEAIYYLGAEKFR